MKLTRDGRNIDQSDIGGGAMAAVEAATAALVKPSMRRGGSEGSLKVSGRDVTKSTTSFLQETTRLPQAPGRAEYPGGMTPSDSPDPRLRRDHLASEDQRRAGKEDLGLAGRGSPVQEQGERGRKASAGRHYPAGEGGGSLLQLAQTPNPQQRRLPSPRPQQGPDQADRRPKSLPSGQMFPQERPTSAPSQRPDDPRNGGGGGGGGGGDRDGPDDDRTATDSTDSVVYEAKTHPPKSSCIGTTYEGYPEHGLMPSGSKLTTNDHLRQRWREETSGKNGRPHASQAQMTQGSTGRGDGGGGGGGDYREGGDGVGGSGPRELAMASGAGAGGLYSSTESLRLARMSAGGGAETEPRATNAPRPGRDRGNGSGRGPLPREIRTSSQSAAPSAEAQRARGGVHSTPPPGRKYQAGGASGADFARPHRRGFGGSESAAAESSLLNGLLRQNAGSSLPLPSRKGANNVGRSGDGGIGAGTGSDAGRWANPAPRGRQQRDTNASSGYAATYSYPGGSAEAIRGSGVTPTRASRASEEANSSAALSHRPQSSGGSGPRSNRAGGAQTYRSGSPAPGRGRRASAAAAAAAAAVTLAAAGVSDSSRYMRQQATAHGAHKPRQHRSGIPPGFRGYIMPAGSSGADGVGYGTAAPRGHAAPSSTSRDRGRRMGRDVAGRQGVAAKAGTMGVVPRSFSIANSSFGQRPSTTEGLTGDSVGGRRGRSSSPAPRPSSASGRRRSASPSPANLLGTTIGQTASGVGLFMVPSFDRPRWK